VPIDSDLRRDIERVVAAEHRTVAGQIWHWIAHGLGNRGYGFIVPTDDGPAVFFHVKDCFLRDHYLQVGDRVLFELNQFERARGRRAASEMRVINGTA
jgi:cold shock CspA family protein